MTSRVSHTHGTLAAGGPPQWIAREIANGLESLMFLSLDWTPQGQMMAGTQKTWVNAIASHGRWDEARDVSRFRQAFATLAATATRWPLPRTFLDALPALVETPAASVLDDATRAAARARLHQILDTLTQHAAVG